MPVARISDGSTMRLEVWAEPFGEMPEACAEALVGAAGPQFCAQSIETGSGAGLRGDRSAKVVPVVPPPTEVRQRR